MFILYVLVYLKPKPFFSFLNNIRFDCYIPIFFEVLNYYACLCGAHIVVNIIKFGTISIQDNV